MSRKKPDGHFNKKEAALRFEAALRGARLVQSKTTKPKKVKGKPGK
jgi:hypothetical protein